MDICNRKDNVAHDWHSSVKLACLFNVAVSLQCAHHFCSAKTLFFHGCKICCCAYYCCKHLRKMEMKTDNAIVLRWSNNVAIHGSQRGYIFHKTKVVISFVSTVRVTKLKAKTTATPLTKTAFAQIYCNVKTRCDAHKKKNAWCSRKLTFHYHGKLQEIFRAGFNEIKYDYADFQHHFYLTCCSNRRESTLQKVNDPSQRITSLLYIIYTAKYIEFDPSFLKQITQNQRKTVRRSVTINVCGRKSACELFPLATNHDNVATSGSGEVVISRHPIR